MSLTLCMASDSFSFCSIFDSVSSSSDSESESITTSSTEGLRSKWFAPDTSDAGGSVGGTGETSVGDADWEDEDAAAKSEAETSTVVV